jgi:tetratricopeptide (TPR) repeat protein
LIQLFEIGKIENVYTFLCKKRNNKRPLKHVSIEFAKKGNHEASLIFVNEDYRLQNDMFEKSLNLMNVAIEITNNKINLVTDSIIKESVKCANLIDDYFEKSKVFSELSTKLFNLGKLKQSLSFIKKAKKFAHKISDDIEKVDAMLNIAIEFLEQGSQKQSSLILKEILESKKSLKCIKTDCSRFNPGNTQENMLEFIYR